MSNNLDIDRHKYILGIIYLVLSGLHLLFVFIATIFISEIVAMTEPESFQVFNMVKYVVVTLTIVLTLPGIVAGIGLLYKKDWALLIAFIISIIALPLFPLWTILSVYTIVIFIMSQQKRS